MKALLSICAALAVVGTAMNVDAPPAVVASDSYTKVSVLASWMRSAVQPSSPSCAVTSPSFYTINVCNPDYNDVYIYNSSGLFYQQCADNQPTGKAISVPIEECYFNGKVVPGQAFGVQLNKLI